MAPDKILNIGFFTMSEGATIFALSSPPGRGGVAVFRITGPDAARAFDVFHVKQPQARRATRVFLREDIGAVPIDDAIALWFPNPHSFTGEDCVELHTHSGRAIIARVLKLLSQIPGFRPAEGGEFTRRAFGAGKIDLIEAEGLADLIDAETEAQRKQAMRQFGGALSALYADWQSRIADSLAFLEAVIDFGDEEDVSEAQPGLQRDVLQDIFSEMVAHLDDRGRGEILRAGLQVAIVGRPNVGKSSLLNLLAKREAAIVSDIAGTTRDRIEVDLDISGVPVRLIDTAGLRDTSDPVEGEGVRRSQESAKSADLVLYMTAPDGETGRIPQGDGIASALDGNEVVRLLNKSDLLQADAEGTPGLDHRGAGDKRGGIGEAAFAEVDLCISVQTGDGITELLDLFKERLDQVIGSEEPAITRERHRDAVATAAAGLRAALDLEDRILAAEELRAAAASLGRVVGRLDVEQLLDRIFSQFCIGK